MSATSFRSVFMVASCAGAALGCYLVSLRVASERAALEEVESEIVMAQRDIRLLQTEIGTRGRLAQLERWNVKVLALSAPSADQFLGGGFELARMVAPERKVDLEAPVVLAAAPAQSPARVLPEELAVETGKTGGPDDLMHSASLVRAPKEVRVGATATPKVEPKASAPANAAKQKSVAKPVMIASRAVTSRPSIAKTDPLAPLPAPAKAVSAKDRGSKQ